VDRNLDHLIEFVAALTAVDGAVVLSCDLRLFGFGSEITVTGTPAVDETIEYARHPSPLGKPDAVSLAQFGMRHRSASRLCQRVPGTMAFVVSQDSGIRLFQIVDGSLTQWVELMPEEW
jgi:DNA integrity scanning protein DisA with diadenylate cyclase activity